jgi:branched-chain amino acid transport system permease protein
MIAALQILVDALSLGSLYALATLGVGLVFGVLRLANFAYGDFITVASYALIVPTAGATAEIVIGRWPWPLLVAAVVGVVVILSLVSDYLVFRPLRTAKPAVLMVGSFALGYIIQNIIIVVYDGRPKAIGIWPGLGEAIVLGGLRVPRLEILTIVATCADARGLRRFSDGADAWHSGEYRNWHLFRHQRISCRCGVFAVFGSSRGRQL